jgi:hypothetical protein
MHRRHAREHLLALAGLITFAPIVPAQQVPSGQRVGVRARTVHVYSAVGRVTLRRGAGELGITATARGEDGRELRFFLDRDGDSAVFRVQYPDVEEIASPDFLGANRQQTNLRLREDGTFGGDGGDDLRFWRRRRGRGTEVEIGGRRGFRGWADVELTVPDGAVLKVHLAVGEAGADSVSGDVMIDTWSAHATARGVAGDWLFDTGSGNVEVRGARGRLRLDTGSGNCSVTGVRGDLLDVDTGSGDVDATDVDVARFRFDTGSGNVRARNLRAARGVADTGSGDVVLDYSGGPVEDLLIDTGSGSVDLRLPQAADARVTVDTGSGGIMVDRSGGVYERRSDEGVVLRFGEGRGRIRIDTGSGDITIR